MCAQPDAHILIIAAEPARIAGLMALLRASSFRVSFALDAQQGLLRCQTLLPHVVLSDYELPSMRGDMFMRMLRSNPVTAAIPVLFLSSIACVEAQMRALRSGARDFIFNKTHEGLILERLRLHLNLREIGFEKQADTPVREPIRREEDLPRNHLVEAVQEYIQDNLADTLSAEFLATLFGLTERRLNEEFKQALGLTVHDFVRSTRMRHAMSLLSQTDLAVTNVAAESGYINPANFATAFRQYSGFSPSAYRRRHRAKN
ncbi:AraC family transcriptional regulator [Alcaligenes sp. SDU_A2]|uniref:AraC family transcriptional regulator n=1 Tax=Alcaligenes sp. SDU_A2 TaxID=3136634 RepID=UPI002C7F4413|nr:DNA-binding response regulator [Alcaligenes sp.]HRL26329.1 DNA-binding response regulator [Alcaligenes sp.]